MRDCGPKIHVGCRFYNWTTNQATVLFFSFRSIENGTVGVSSTAGPFIREIKTGWRWIDAFDSTVGMEIDDVGIPSISHRPVEVIFEKTGSFNMLGASILVGATRFPSYRERGR